MRTRVGMFDVSHMQHVDVAGPGSRRLLSRILANNVAKLTRPGKALYSCMLNEEGGVVDDLIVYFLGGHRFRLVVNAATAATDLEWIAGHARGVGDAAVTAIQDLVMIAVQGPQARDRAVRALAAADAPVLPEDTMDLAPFCAVESGELFIARTGYTGEDGFEIAAPAAHGVAVWRALADDGVPPCGLGARDTLRLEAGMNLYGADMDAATTPLESGLGWTVGWDPPDRRFVGRQALEDQRRQGVARKLVGLVLLDRGVLRSHQRVICRRGEGEVTSGSFSPTLNQSIAMARVPAGVEPADECQVDVRGKLLAARVVDYPFVRNGRSCL